MTKQRNVLFVINDNNSIKHVYEIRKQMMQLVIYVAVVKVKTILEIFLLSF